MAKRRKQRVPSPEDAEISPAHVNAPLWQIIVQALIIIAAAVWVYAPALRGDWLWDDDLLVSVNPDLRSVAGLWHIWFSAPTTDYWPLTWTLLWTEWHVWGNDPLGYHLCSLALHIISGLLIWRLLRRLGLRWGWIGGLLFVVHPIAVESVAWISEIKNTLSLPLFLLACDAWIDSESGKRGRPYLRAILLYTAAMLAKTSTIMLPAVLLLYTWWKRGKIYGSDLKNMAPFLGIALILGAVTFHFQSHALEASSGQVDHFFARLVRTGAVVFFYLGNFVWPANLLPVYPRSIFDPALSFRILALLVLAGMLFLLWTKRQSWGRHLLFGLGFFLLNLLPVLGVVKMSYLRISGVADHFAYLPIIGLIGLVAAGIELLQRPLAIQARLIGWILVAVLAVALGWKSHAYAKIFVNLETFCEYTLARNPEAWSIHNNLGHALFQNGRIPGATEQFQQALAINPDDAEAHYNLGIVLEQANKMPEAIDEFQAALKLNHDDADSHNKLGVALQATGRIPEATEQFQAALSLDPSSADSHNKLGVALAQTSQMPEAISEFEQAVNLNPERAEAHYNLGLALAETGRMSDALEQFNDALRINPNDARTHYNVGVILESSGQIPEAMEQYEIALRIDPSHANARAKLTRLQDLQKAAGAPTTP
jgi:protein O-mannosyl-transferase